MSKFNAQEIIDNHGGKCKTRDGGDAVIYAVYPNQKAAIHGAMSFAPCGNMSEWSWLIDGRGLGAKDSPDDLIMPRTVVAETYLIFAHIGTPQEQVTPYEKRQNLGRLLSDLTVPPQVRVTLYSDDTVESEVVI